jgi:predicted SnoaL-like aldol condensation-catalyzing enzyme
MESVQAKAIVLAYFERLLNEHDLSVCDELLAPDYVDHDAPADTPPGPESTKEYMRELFAAYSELRVEIADVIADRDRVALRGVWHGVDNDSRRYRQGGLVFVRLNEHGQLAERWSAYEPGVTG